MEVVYQQLLERNSRETTPFLAIYESYTTLLNLTDTLQQKCSISEHEVEHLRQQLRDLDTSSTRGGTTSSNDTAMKSALKSEARLRDKLELLQEELNVKLKDELKKANILQEAQAANSSYEKRIKNLVEQLDNAKEGTGRLQKQLEESMSNLKLLEEQNDKLKDSLRAIQNENDILKKENFIFEGRLVAEKGKAVDEMNELTDMVERLKAEVDMLRLLAQQEKERQKADAKKSQSWFSTVPTKSTSGNNAVVSTAIDHPDDAESETRKFGVSDISIIPSKVQHTITAHSMEGTCVRYDESGLNLVATSSSDSTVKIWDTLSGHQRGVFRGSPASSIICCDIGNDLVVGGSSDKTCRVWNQRSERMVHQLVGHQNKITCVRLFGGDKPNVITGSADRSLKVWDISRTTYRQTTTLRHSSTSTCVDVASDSINVATGHMDGVVRFWDLRSGERTTNSSVTHEGGILSVQFKPTDNTMVLTSSADSSLRIFDIRIGKIIHTFNHPEHLIGQHRSRSTFSPDGRYVASASSVNGIVFVWDTLDGSLKAKLTNGHQAGIICIDWCRGGTGGQQFASLDRNGVLVLWA